MTFAVAARCESSGMLGVAVASSSPAVAARCAFASARVGAVASQNITDPSLGEQALAQMRGGADARQTIARVTAANPNIHDRQLLAVDNAGGSEVFSGDYVLGIGAQTRGDNYAAAGNLLRHDKVIEAMVDGLLAARGELGGRLLAALRAAADAGGEAGPIHSAGIKIARDASWAYVDLRCDWHEDDPISELHRLWQIYQPQADDYVLRATNPAQAPGFNVPGDN